MFSLVGQQELSSKAISYTTVLGRGAYAAVYRAKCDELPCAAKILHTIFYDDPALLTLQERFYQECEYLKSIKHPNIVQYLGLCQEPAANQPVLLMELMDQSLTSFLESSTVPLSRSVQFHLCQDVALALAHLHSLNIIHRDLSSNNVLLIGPGSRAKVSDFGMSKVIDTTNSRFTTPLTMVPGTLAYMPQEALGENPKYTEKLDCFSFGVLVIQILTRLFPNPLPRKREVESALSLTGTVLVPVAETECRKEHIDMINRQHPLLDVAIECLALRMEDRPSARELCLRVEELQVPSPREATTEESSSHSPLADEQSCRSVECQETKQHLEGEIVRLQQLLGERPEDSEPASEPEECPMCAELRAENRALEENMQESKQNSEEVRQELDEVLQNSVLLTEVEHCPVYTELKTRKEELEKLLEECHEVIQRLEDGVAEKPEEVLQQSLDPGPCLRCAELEETRGSLEERVTTLMKEVSAQQEITETIVLQQSAKVLDPGPCPRCAELEEMRGALEERVTTLIDEMNAQQEITETILGQATSRATPLSAPATPAPPELRSLPGVVSVSDWRTGLRAPYIVAGGSGCSTFSNHEMFCSIFELIYRYDVRSNSWQELPKLVEQGRSYLPGDEMLVIFHRSRGMLYPVKGNVIYSIADGKWYRKGGFRIVLWGILDHEEDLLVFGKEGEFRKMEFNGNSTSLITSPKISYASPVVCNGAVYLIGAVFTASRLSTSQVYRLPLDALYRKTSLATNLWHSITSKTAAWQEITPLPVTRSTGVTFKGHLMAVGGYYSGAGVDHYASGDIFSYNEEEEEWLVVGRIPTPRYRCLAEVVGDQLVVVGGWLDDYSKCDLVEIATLH